MTHHRPDYAANPSRSHYDPATGIFSVSPAFYDAEVAPRSESAQRRLDQMTADRIAANNAAAERASAASTDPPASNRLSEDAGDDLAPLRASEDEQKVRDHG